MVYIAETNGAFVNTSSSTLKNPTSYEQDLIDCPNLSLWLTPQNRDIATHKAGQWLADRKSGYLAKRVGTQKITASGFNSGASFGFDANGYYLLDKYQIPPSFTILAAFTYNSAASYQLLFGSKTSSDGRVYFGVGLSSSVIRPWFDTSSSSSDRLTGSAALSAGNHVLWGSFDASNLAMRLGFDNVTPQYSKTVTNVHKGQIGSVCGGFTDSSSHYVKDDVGAVLVFDVPLHEAAYSAQLEAALAYLGNLSGVTITGL